MVVEKEHVMLMSAYISTQITDAYLTEITATNTFVKNFKKVTNNYTNFLESEVYKKLQKVYDLDEEMIELLFKKMKKQTKRATDNFIKEMLKITE